MAFLSRPLGGPVSVLRWLRVGRHCPCSGIGAWAVLGRLGDRFASTNKRHPSARHNPAPSVFLLKRLLGGAVCTDALLIAHKLLDPLCRRVGLWRLPCVFHFSCSSNASAMSKAYLLAASCNAWRTSSSDSCLARACRRIAAWRYCSAVVMSIS
jgi:hypothetical protein